MSDNQYSTWETRRSLGVMRHVVPEYRYWSQWFTEEMYSDDEYIDFTKLPARGRKIAPMVMPLARGKPVYSDAETAFRLKPGYVKVEDQIDELMPIRRMAGLEAPIIEPGKALTPMQRLNAIRAQMTAEHVLSIERRFEWMASKALIDGQVTLTGENYPTTFVDFKRASDHTVTLDSNAQWGDEGISIVDSIQSLMDRVNDAEHGGLVTRITMGGDVWKIGRKDTELLDHMDTNKRGGNITIERGLVSSEKIFKVGEMLVGGNSGQTIELWVNNETYEDPETGVETRYLGAKDIVMTCAPSSVAGMQCFGMIVDRKAEYKALRIFPKNWTSETDVTVEYLTHKSAPIFVPMYPNRTLKATVVA